MIKQLDVLLKSSGFLKMNLLSMASSLIGLSAVQLCTMQKEYINKNPHIHYKRFYGHFTLK